jgi:DNA-binding MarR family transcriptional regulator
LVVFKQDRNPPSGAFPVPDSLMDHQDLRTLKFLEAIESGQSTSQRDLAEQLNISLGLVNSFIKRLARKGYFKITHIPRNRVAYLLTPKGVAEKSRLTYEYIQFSFRYFRDARRKLKTLLVQCERQNVKRIVFWGISDLAEIAYLSLHETGIELVGIADGDRAGETFFGHRVLSAEELKKVAFDRVLITAINTTADIERQILDAGVNKCKIANVT